MLDEAESNLFDITQKNLNRRYTKLGDLAVKAQKELESLSKKVEGMTGVPSGFTNSTASQWAGNVLTLSSWLLVLVWVKPHSRLRSPEMRLSTSTSRLRFSLEMSALQLTHRLMSMVAEIPGTKLRNAQLEDYEWQQLNTAVERFSKYRSTSMIHRLSTSSNYALNVVVSKCTTTFSSSSSTICS
jgi:replicative DNA helicase